MISKEEFADWQRNPVTREMVKWISEQVEQAKETLASDAGINPLADRDLVGGITAFKDVLDWKPEFIEENYED